MSAAEKLAQGEVPRLVDLLLAEQRSLSAVDPSLSAARGSRSAVDVFAERHEQGALPAGARAYQELIPLHRVPQPGQQLAFRVDLDACTGCKACVTACHSLNGLAPEETWRDVGLIVGGGVQQTVTTACHHCEDPACLSGCPVRAYEKDPVTGIVRHLDDQCIGCQYCVLKCPYDVPKYLPALGIVRKCDMCTGRLAVGEAPACVQGCPNSAISIQIVDQRGTGELLPGVGELLPGVNGTIPDSAYTRPTTRYASKRLAGPLQPADLDRLEPAPAHDPLAVNLVLLQLSVGTLLFDVPLSAAASAAGEPLRLALAALAALAGLGAASFHLGRPLYAFRAFLGWRTSWMSREIIAFGAYLPALLGALAASSLVHVEALRAFAPAGLVRIAAALAPALVAAALVLGLAGTLCSVMIYVDTRRALWALRRTAPSFVLTLVGLGALGAGLATVLATSAAAGVLPLTGVGGLALALKVAREARFLRGPRHDPRGELARTVRLLRGVLRARMRARFAAAAAGALLAAAALAGAALGHDLLALAAGALSFAGFALGEGVERHLYFTSEASRGMPGA